MVQTVNLTLCRDKPGPWGFRLNGGVDFEKALTVSFAQEGSFSFNSGLRTGDVIVNIGSLEAALLTHKEAQEAILQQGNSVQLTVQRSGCDTGMPPGTWKPDVQIIGGPATTPAGQDQVYTKTSLQLPPKPQEEHWDVKHNITARGFQPGSAGAPAPPIQSVSAPSSNNSAGGVSGFRSVSAPIQRPGAPGPPVAPAAAPMQICWICNKPISGVFLQVKGRPLHEECFKCETCKCSLKNVGHFVIGEKLYCQTHAREAQNALKGNAAESSSDAHPGAAIGKGIPQGLAQNLAKISIKPQQPPLNKGNPVAPPPPTPAASAATSGSSAQAQWASRLNENTAGMASNAEEFTKEFMKQLTEGTGV